MGENDKTLTPLELQMMQAVWRIDGGTVAEVQSALEQQLAYTTVQTMLNILQRKGKLRRKLNGRAFVYRAAVTETKANAHAVRDLVNRVFGGSTEDLVMNLIETHQLDSAQIARLQKLAKAAEKKSASEAGDGIA